MCSEGRLDLLDLGHTDALNLTLTDTVAVENNLLWSRTVVALESLNSTRHASLQVRRAFLANLVLDDARGPVSRG